MCEEFILFSKHTEIGAVDNNCWLSYKRFLDSIMNESFWNYSNSQNVVASFSH